MEKSISWEADSGSAGQKNPSFLWSMMVHYYIQKNPSLDPTLSPLNPG
jgi:hypothetical protein